MIQDIHAISELFHKNGIQVFGWLHINSEKIEWESISDIQQKG